LACLAVFLLSKTQMSSFGCKVGFVFTVGIIAAVATHVPYANWYGFPKDFTLGQMMTQVIGFLLVGIVAALLLGKKTEAAT